MNGYNQNNKPLVIPSFRRGCLAEYLFTYKERRLLGHRDVNDTLIYTHLVDYEALEYVSKTAKSVEEACKLVDAGFEYVSDFDGAKIFRKSKWSFTG